MEKIAPPYRFSCPTPGRFSVKSKSSSQSMCASRRKTAFMRSQIVRVPDTSAGRNSEPPRISKTRAHSKTRLRRVRDGHKTRKFIPTGIAAAQSRTSLGRVVTGSEQEPRLGADTIFPSARVHLRGRARHIAERTEDAAIALDRLHYPAAPFTLIEVLNCVFVHGLTCVMSACRTHYCGYKLIHRSTRPDALDELH